MYHIVYLTTNLVNNKIYVGVHSTYNLNDGYLGSGDKLKLAIKKYGKENFQRQILHFAYDKIHMYELEKIIVNKWFISKPNTYNVNLGGLIPPDNTGKKLIITEKHRKNMSLNHADVKGNKNPRARKVLCIFPNGNELILHGNYLTFIKELGFNHQTIRPLIDTGKINKPILPNHSIKTKEMIMKLNGFEFQYI